MEYKISFREKDKSIQCIISYKDEHGEWRQKSKQGFKTQKESKPWQDKMLKTLKKTMEQSSKLNQDYKGITLKEYGKLFLKDLKRYSEPNTVDFFRKTIKKFKSLNDEKLTDITLLHIQNCANDMVDEGLKTSTILDYLSKFKTMLNTAIEPYKMIVENPVNLKKIKLPEDKAKDDRVKALTKSELDQLLKVISPNKDYLISLIASNCGLRIGEILGLTWDNVDLKNRTLHIKQQWKLLDIEKRTCGFGTLKTKNSYRDVPIPINIVPVLVEYEKTCVKDLFNDRLFIEKRTDACTARLNQKYKRLGFNISVHSLRHTYVSMLVAKGFDFKTIAELIGDTVETTIKTYAHFTDDMMEEARSKIDQIF